MRNQALDRAVERLMTDRRFRRRFRRSPARALRGSGLGEAEIEALKRGRAEELFEFGVDPSYIFPAAPLRAAPLQIWMLRNARRLVPAALLAGATLAFAAAPAPAGRTRAKSKVKITKYLEKPNSRVVIKGWVRSKKGKCERRRDLRVFLKFDGENFPLADGRTNRKGRFKIRRRFVPPPGMHKIYAKVEKEKSGKLVCKPDKSPNFKIDGDG